MMKFVLASLLMFGGYAFAEGDSEEPADEPTMEQPAAHQSAPAAVAKKDPCAGKKGPELKKCEAMQKKAAKKGKG